MRNSAGDPPSAFSYHQKNPASARFVVCKIVCNHDSQRADLNCRPHPYHGCALPTELRWHDEAVMTFVEICESKSIAFIGLLPIVFDVLV